jgi:hypothetical protein
VLTKRRPYRIQSPRFKLPWATWTRGRPITAHQVSKLLGPFGIPSPRTIRIGSRTNKGYRFDDFTDAFPRYLPPLTVTPSQAADSLGSSDNSTVTGSEDGNRKNTADCLRCDVVTDEDSSIGEIDGGSANPTPSRPQANRSSSTRMMKLNGNGPSSSKRQRIANGNGAMAGPVVKPASVKVGRFGWVKRLLGDMGA